MFALPGILIVLVLDYFKPQEVFPILASLPLLYIATALAFVGFIIDLRLGVTRLRATPQLPWVVAFYLLAIVATVVKAPANLVKAVFLLIPISLYLLVGHAVQTFRGFHVVAGSLLAISLVLASIGVHQRMQDPTCHRITEGYRLVNDGRECEAPSRARQCFGEGAEPGADYACERPGLLNTSTVAGRVRFRGTLADPNELSLAVCIALPFAFALYERRRGAASLAFLIFTTVLVGVCSVFTASRGGQLVFLAVLGTYFVRRAGVKGLILGAVLSMPMLLFGGRSGAESDQSTMERIEALQAGFDMLRASPLLGVGFGQFTELHYLTAHNAYMLPAAELGPLGLYLFSMILYLSGKTCVLTIRRAARSELPPVAETAGVAMIATLAGMMVGIFFLSFTYKEVLWIYVGLWGALYQSIKRRQPDFEVTTGWTEKIALAAGNVLLLIALRIYVRIKSGF